MTERSLIGLSLIILKDLIKDKRTFRHLIIDVVGTTVTLVDKSMVRISMDMNSEKNMLYLCY